MKKICLKILGDCPVGHYCPRGTADPIGCAAGTYNDLTNQDSCKICEAGYYCLANSTTYSGSPCPKGKHTIWYLDIIALKK